MSSSSFWIVIFSWSIGVPMIGVAAGVAVQRVSKYIARVGCSLFFMMFDACFDGLSITLRVCFQLGMGTVFKKCVQISWEVRALMCWFDLSSEGIEIRDLGLYLCQFCIVLVNRGWGFGSAFLV